MIQKAFTYRVIAEISALLIGAFSMIYMTRAVGPEYIGFYATTSAVLMLLTRLADGGMTSLATQRLATGEQRLCTLITTTMPVKVTCSLILIIITLFVTNIIDIDQRLKHFISVSVFVILFDSCTTSWVFVSTGRINFISITRIIQVILYAILVLYFVNGPADWKIIPYISIANSSVGFLVNLLLISKLKTTIYDPTVFAEKYIKNTKTFIRESFDYFKADLSIYIYTSSDRIILYYFSGSYSVGIYEAAYKIINPFYMIAGVINQYIYRDLAKDYKSHKISSVMSRYVFIMAIATIPLGFYLLYFSSFIVNTFYGGSFAGSVSCLMVLGFVITFGYTNGIIVFPFSAWNMPKEYGNSILWGNILNTALNFILIPFAGPIGAALATLGAKITVTIVGYYYFRRATNYPILKDYLLFFIASVIPLLSVIILSAVLNEKILLTLIFILIYSLLVWSIYNKYFKLRMIKTS